jgi:hypothetical protein
MFLLSASANFLLGLLFDPEYGGSMFLQNIWLSLNYKQYSPEGTAVRTSNPATVCNIHQLHTIE